MGRVTGDEVKAIIKTTLTSDQVAPMITAANLLVTAKTSGEGYSDAELKEIERWLSAHFVSIRSPGSVAVEKAVGETRERYATIRSNPKRALETTPYGQQVLILDYKGCFSYVGVKVASITAIGKPNDEFSSEVTQN